MKWAYYIKYKVKAAGILTIIITLIVISVFTVQNSFSRLGNSMTSIYNDRLMPATYIFEITDHLYQKRLLQEGGDVQQIASHNRAIAGLIGSYEATTLTAEEKLAWKDFKTSLQQYNEAEVKGMDANMESAFNKAMLHLNALSRIQTGEGKQLHNNSEKIISGNILTSNLEISLLIVLALYTLVILSATDNRIFQKPQNQFLN